MAFYIVVHHPDDPDPTKWANDWDDDGLLRAITTPRGVANRCVLARDRIERIFVHRCAWGGAPAVIRCSVEVSEINDIDKTSALVRFSSAKLVGAEPSVLPQQGQNSYDADPPEAL
jgi:YD repeat-containing protein